MHKEITQQLTHLLHTQFGFSHFREGQLESLISLMTHGRLLCIQPTGFGKSLLYQIPSLLHNGITLVISPLLALMRDQVDQLNQRFNIPAASLNTDQNNHENYAVMRAVREGKIRIIFIAPEQLASIHRFEFLLSLPIQLLVVDEAHCISTWGHDFRPSYRRIIQLTHAITSHNADIKILALTATANKKTEEDIKKQLAIGRKKIRVQRESMNRPNIRLTVIPVTGVALKLSALTQVLQKLQGSGLIYCATRENTEIVAEYLRSRGIKSAAYHAGINVNLKHQIQQGFIHDVYPVIAATNALGMGIDKPNLRFVIHFDFPGSITAYYQEVGRCGRDGLSADGILLYDSKDSQVQNYFIDSAQPSAEEFDYVLRIIASSKVPLHITHLKHIVGMHPTKLNVIIAELMEQGFLQQSRLEGMQVYQLTRKSGKPCLSRYEAQYKIRRYELASMQRYAEDTRQCLMVTLRLALGDKKTKPCECCSVCAKSAFDISNDKKMFLEVADWVDSKSSRKKASVVVDFE